MKNVKEFTELCREDKLKVLEELRAGNIKVDDIKADRVFIAGGFYSSYLRSTNPEKYADKIIIQGTVTGNFYDWYMLSQPENENVMNSN